MKPADLIKVALAHKKKFLKYLISGGSAFITNLGLLYFFTEVFNIWYVFSSIIAFAASFSVAFTLQKFWTFNDRSTAELRQQLTISFSVALFNLVLNTAFVYLLVEQFSLHYIFAQILTTGVIAIESFLMYQYVIFVSKPDDQPQGE
jgi:putative flippase GtrA